MNVYAIEQRSGDATDVPLNLQRRTTTFARGVIPEATGTPLRCLFATSQLRLKNRSLQHILEANIVFWERSEKPPRKEQQQLLAVVQAFVNQHAER